MRPSRRSPPCAGPGKPASPDDARRAARPAAVELRRLERFKVARLKCGAEFSQPLGCDIHLYSHFFTPYKFTLATARMCEIAVIAPLDIIPFFISSIANVESPVINVKDRAKVIIFFILKFKINYPQNRLMIIQRFKHIFCSF